MNYVARIDKTSALPALVTVPTPGDSARRYARASKSDGTLRAYGSALRSFEAWCSAHGLQAVPADVTTVVDFLSAEADAGRKVSSIAQKAAAIRWAHKTAGLPSPFEAEAVQNVMRGIRREVGVAPVQKLPATAERILTMIAHIPDTMAGKRDRAMLLLGFAGAFRRSELAALLIDDLTFGEAGVDVLIRRSKTDQEGQGQTVAVPYGTHLLPVQALQRWLAKVEATNIGQRAVTITGIGIELPGGGTFARFQADAFPGVPDSSLPITLDDGQSGFVHYTYADLGAALIQSGRRGKVKLTSYAEDSAGNRHRGQQWETDGADLIRTAEA